MDKYPKTIAILKKIFKDYNLSTGSFEFFVSMLFAEPKYIENKKTIKYINNLQLVNNNNEPVHFNMKTSKVLHKTILKLMRKEDNER